MMRKLRNLAIGSGLILLLLTSLGIYLISWDIVIRDLYLEQQSEEEPFEADIPPQPTLLNFTNDYQLRWEPNKIRGSTHSIAITEDKQLVAVGGGYLSDNTIHIYRWNNITSGYDHVWDSGDEIIQNDVLSVALADSDNNGLLEVIAGCADARIYVFEQRAPESTYVIDRDKFEYVWNSGSILTRQVWTVAIDDLDADSRKEIIAGCWDNRVYVFEFESHSGFPYCAEHWMNFVKVWDSGNEIRGRVYDVTTGDTDYDSLKELIVGAGDCKVHVFEFLPCGIHRYEKIWDSGDTLFEPVLSVTVSSDLDYDPYGEIAATSYGQGVFVFEYDPGVQDFTKREIYRPPETWELGNLPDTWLGYELDPFIDNKTFGWEPQGIFEWDTVPDPWDFIKIGGNSSLCGPLDGNRTTFMPRDNYQYRGRLGMGGEGPGELNYPTGVAFDSANNIYIADKGNSRIQKFALNGTFLTLWGSWGTAQGQFNYPHGVAVGPDDSVFVADTSNHRIQKFNSTGAFIISWGSFGSGDGEFNAPEGIAVDSTGFVYVTDTGNHRVQKFNGTTGFFITSWGGFDTPRGIAVDSEDNLFVVDSHHHLVKKYDETGSLLLQFGQFGADPDTFLDPRGIAIDVEGQIYVTDWGLNQIKKFTGWGQYIAYWGNTGSAPGEFYFPEGIAIGPNDHVYVADSGVNRTQLFALEIFPLINHRYLPILESRRAACDSLGNLYVTDTLNGTIKKFAPNGEFIAILCRNGTDPGELFWPWGLAIDAADNIYVAELGNYRIQKLTSDGVYITHWGTQGSGPIQFLSPYDVAIDANGDIYVADGDNHRIQKFTNQGTFIREWGSYGSNNGEFIHPTSVDVDAEDVVYVADWGNGRIQKFDIDGGYLDQWSADLIAPTDIAIDAIGHVYVADNPFTLIKKYTSTGEKITEIQGLLAGYNVTFTMQNAIGVALDPQGFLYIVNGPDLIKLKPTVVLGFVAEAIADFGENEELGGDATPAADLKIFIPWVWPSMDLRNLAFGISLDGWNFIEIPASLIWLSGIPGNYSIEVDIDPLLAQLEWPSYRYLKIGVKHGVTYRVDAAWGLLALPIDNVLCLTTGQIQTHDSPPTIEHIIMGTVDGSIRAYTAKGIKIWESHRNLPYFSLDASIRDIEYLGILGCLPTWIFHQTFLHDSDLLPTIINQRFEGYIMVDVDQDTRLDLVLTLNNRTLASHGGFWTRMIYLRNIGSNTNPIYIHLPDYFRIRVSGSAGWSDAWDSIAIFGTPSMADLDKDGDLDLIVSFHTTKGTGLEYFENNGTNYWTLVPDVFNALNSVLKWRLGKPAFFDLDGDGDLDLTVAAGDLNYFERQGTGSTFQWILHDTYYQGINELINITTHSYGQAAFSDFDHDGDFDVTIPRAPYHSGWIEAGLESNSSRLTYFENTGSLTQPVWVRHRSFYEPDFYGNPLTPERGYVDPQFLDLNGDSIPDLVLLKNNSIDCFYGSLIHNSFLVATYPLIHIIEVDKRPYSWGFDVFDSWDNHVELDPWTYSIDFADSDNDGIAEVIVGSFDQNIYAFEHVFNNTYRRAWRSPDLTHIKYLWGNYTQTIWDDVRSLVVGDQDSDGKQEIIAAAGSRIYVFENRLNDQYELVWHSGWTIPSIMINSTDPIIEDIAIDPDLDQDGNGEILAVCENFAFVFESDADDHYTLVWLTDFVSITAYQWVIHSVVTGDPDLDGVREILLGMAYELHDYAGGVVDADGMVYIFENIADNDFLDYAVFDNSRLVGQRVHTVELANHSGNPYPEIIVGADLGVFLFERVSNNVYDYLTNFSTPAPAICLAMGNTDNDSWSEIIVGSGKQFIVFEQNSSEPTSQHHYILAWNSSELASEVTDITLGDSNANDRWELIGTTAGGYVFGFEWVPNVTELAEVPGTTIQPYPVMEENAQTHQFIIITAILENQISTMAQNFAFCLLGLISIGLLKKPIVVNNRNWLFMMKKRSQRRN
jgi:DNA-binding beta-propeller fold protein YncE